MSELTPEQQTLLKLPVDQLKALIDKNIADSVQLSEAQKVIGNIAAVTAKMKIKECADLCEYAILKLKTR